MKKISQTYIHNIIIISILTYSVIFIFAATGIWFHYNSIYTDGIKCTGYYYDGEIEFEYNGAHLVAETNYSDESDNGKLVTFYYKTFSDNSIKAVIEDEIEDSYILYIFSIIGIISIIIVLVLKDKKNKYVQSIRSIGMNAKATITNAAKSDSYIIINGVYDDPFENRILHFKTPKLYENKLIKLVKKNQNLKGFLYVTYLKENPNVYIVEAYELK